MIERPPSTEWEKAEHSFKFKQSHADFMDQVRFLVFIHEGWVFLELTIVVVHAPISKKISSIYVKPFDVLL